LAGAAGFEIDQISLPNDPQLKKDIVKVLKKLQTLLNKLHSSNQILAETTSELITTDYMKADKVSSSTKEDSS
jgi:hypothetical protein